MNLANEGFEARKKEEEVATKKRKAEDDARWEGELRHPCLFAPVSYFFSNSRTACRQLEKFLK